jgi:hypothetical protein
MMQQPITSAPFSWTSEPKCLPQTLKDTFVEVLVNNLTLWDKFMVHNSVDIKELGQHALDIQANLPGLLWARR